MLADLADLKLLLGVTGDPATDAALRLHLGGADAAVKSYCGRDFEKATYTEYPDCTRGPELVLNEFPVRQITGVDADAVELGVWYQADGYWGTPAGSFAAATKLVSGTDYALDPDGSGRLYRIGPGWGGGDYGWGWDRGWGYGGFAYGYGGCRHGGRWRGSVKAVYVAGWDASKVPDDLVIEVLHEAAVRWRQASTGSIGTGAGSGVSSTVQLGQFRIGSGSTTSTSSSKGAVTAATLVGANPGVLDRYRVVRLA